MTTIKEVSTSNFPVELKPFGETVELVDCNEELSIYSYKCCDNFSTEEVKNLRGLVYDNKTNQRLFQSVGYTDEYTAGTLPIKLDVENFTIYQSDEGTLIRVFYHTNRWYVATNKKLDAFKSKWGSSESFGDLFIKAIQSFYDLVEPTKESVLEKLTEKMDKTCMYLFLLRNTYENRMVCHPHPEKKIFHVGTFGGSFENIGIPHQERLTFTTREEVVSYVENINPFLSQGLIFLHPKNRPFKLVNNAYAFYNNVRGNVPSVKFRYIQIRTNPLYAQTLVHVFPEYAEMFDLYERIFLELSSEIHQVYMKRFVSKEFTQTDHLRFRIVKEAHGFYIANNFKIKVTLEVIQQILSYQKFWSTLNSLIKQKLYILQDNDNPSNDVEECLEN